ncbi:MAG: transporter substrate-binding domain-containing protein [Desulfovibrionaceae bacterium]
MRRAGLSLVLCILSMSLALPASAGKVRDRVLKSGVLNVAAGAEAAPFGFVNKQKQWVGFDVDLAREIAHRLGVELKITPVKDADRVKVLREGAADLVLAHMTHTRERDRVIDFSITYFQDGQKILAKKGRFDALKEFVGKKIAVAKGSTAIAPLKRMLKELGAKNPANSLVVYPSEADCFQALQAGQVDGWSTDSFILQGYSAPRPGKYEMVGGFIADEPYGIGLPQGDAAWRDTINFTLQDMWLDGTFHEIYERWFGPNSWTYFPMLFRMEVWPR